MAVDLHDRTGVRRVLFMRPGGGWRSQNDLTSARVGGLILVFFFIICLSSCRRKECRGFVELPVPHEVLKYAGPMKPGNWWTFQSASGVSDSLFVESIRQSFAFDETFDPCVKVRSVKVILSSQTLFNEGTANGGYGRFVSPVTIAALNFSDLYAGFGPEGFTDNPRASAYQGPVWVGDELHADALTLIAKDASYIPQELVFSAGIGPVRFVHLGDTFNLQNYHVIP